MFCKNCGVELKENARFCAECGTEAKFVVPATPIIPQEEPVSKPSSQKRKKMAGVLGIFLGAIGLHRFYLGYTGTALIQIILFALGFATFGITAVASLVWGIVDAVRIFKGKLSKDANDNPLI